MEEKIKEMKEWCLENYENGADTMVECWGDEDYFNLLAGSPNVDEAWIVLEHIAAVYRDQQADARHYKENW